MSGWEKPAWLDFPENLCLVNLLTALVKRKNKIKFAITSTPWLFPPTPEEEIDLSLYHIKFLQEKYENFFVGAVPENRADIPSGNIKLSDQAKEAVSSWLKLEQPSEKLIQWQKAIDDHSLLLGGIDDWLNRHPILNSPLDVSDVVFGFAKLLTLLDQSLTVRRISAKSFNGDSKFIETYVAWDKFIAALPNTMLFSVKSRPLNLTVHLPSDFSGVLLVENLDTFNLVLEGGIVPAKRMAIVYSQGFKASSVRVRNRQDVKFFYSKDSGLSTIEIFEKQWFDEADEAASFFFWGDLDFAGMSILSSLVNIFPAIDAWEPGYSLLLEQIKCGHPPDKASKENQKPIYKAGAPWADKYLIPALHKSYKFIDQEII